MLFRSPLRDLENNISSQSKPQHLLRISITLFVGPSVSLAKAAAPGKRSAPTLLRTFKPDGRTVGLGGTIVRVAGWVPASTAWLPNSFPPLGNSRATRVRCKVQNCHLLPAPAAKTCLSIQDAEEVLTLHPPLHWSTMHRRPKFNWLSSLPPFGPKQAKQLDQPFVLAVS